MLAYGDLKKLELAIALANDPALLLLDEPTAGMAPAERGALMALDGARIARERGLTVLFTEHDMDVVFAVADRIMVLHQGRVIAEGAPRRRAREPRGAGGVSRRRAVTAVRRSAARLVPLAALAGHGDAPRRHAGAELPTATPTEAQFLAGAATGDVRDRAAGAATSYLRLRSDSASA